MCLSNAKALNKIIIIIIIKHISIEVQILRQSQRGSQHKQMVPTSKEGCWFSPTLCFDFFYNTPIFIYDGWESYHYHGSQLIKIVHKHI